MTDLREHAPVESKAAEHTPLPWRVEKHPRSAYTYIIGKGDESDVATMFDVKPADAKFIVRAVNSHQPLIDALKALVARHEGYELGCGPCVCEAHVAARAALAAAEGKP